MTRRIPRRWWLFVLAAGLLGAVILAALAHEAAPRGHSWAVGR